MFSWSKGFLGHKSWAHKTLESSRFPPTIGNRAELNWSIFVGDAELFADRHFISDELDWPLSAKFGILELLIHLGGVLFFCLTPESRLLLQTGMTAAWQHYVVCSVATSALLPKAHCKDHNNSHHKSRSKGSLGCIWSLVGERSALDLRIRPVAPASAGAPPSGNMAICKSKKQIPEWRSVMPKNVGRVPISWKTQFLAFGDTRLPFVS